MLNGFRVILAAFVFVIILTVTADAQTYGGASEPEPQLGVEVTKTRFDRGETLPTGATFVWLEYPISHRLSLRADLPVAYGDFSTDSLVGGESTIGNPFLGARYRIDSNTWIQAGIRVPLSRENTASFVGVYADYSRFEAFAEDRWSANVRGTRRFSLWDWTTIETWVGGALLYNRNPGLRADTTVTTIIEDRYDAIVDWGVQVWEGGDVRFGGAIVGRTVLTQSGSLADRSKAQFALMVTTRIQSVYPTVYLRVPLDDGLAEYIDFIVGVNIGWAFR